MCLFFVCFTPSAHNLQKPPKAGRVQKLLEMGKFDFQRGPTFGPDIVYSAEVNGPQKTFGTDSAELTLTQIRKLKYKPIYIYVLLKKQVSQFWAACRPKLGPGTCPTAPA